VRDEGVSQAQTKGGDSQLQVVALQVLFRHTWGHRQASPGSQQDLLSKSSAGRKENNPRVLIRRREREKGERK
jgi:hypothetical protein